MSWEAIIEPTKTGTAKYKPGIDIEILERGVLRMENQAPMVSRGKLRSLKAISVPAVAKE